MFTVVASGYPSTPPKLTCSLLVCQGVSDPAPAVKATPKKAKAWDSLVETANHLRADHKEARAAKTPSVSPPVDGAIRCKKSVGPVAADVACDAMAGLGRQKGTPVKDAQHLEPGAPTVDGNDTPTHPSAKTSSSFKLMSGSRSAASNVAVKKPASIARPRAADAHIVFPEGPWVPPPPLKPQHSVPTNRDSKCLVSSPPPPPPLPQPTIGLLQRNVVPSSASHAAADRGGGARGEVLRGTSKPVSASSRPSKGSAKHCSNPHANAENAASRSPAAAGAPEKFWRGMVDRMREEAPKVSVRVGRLRHVLSGPERRRVAPCFRLIIYCPATCRSFRPYGAIATPVNFQRSSVVYGMS